MRPSGFDDPQKTIRILVEKGQQQNFQLCKEKKGHGTFSGRLACAGKAENRVAKALALQSSWKAKENQAFQGRALTSLAHRVAEAI